MLTINCNDLMQFVINLFPLLLQLKCVRLKTQKEEASKIHVDRANETYTAQDQFVFITEIKENTLHVLVCMKGVCVHKLRQQNSFQYRN
jgi:hypothetical protein